MTNLKLIVAGALFAMACGAETGSSPEAFDPTGAWLIAGKSAYSSCPDVSFDLSVDQYGSAVSPGGLDVCPISVGIIGADVYAWTFCAGVEQTFDVDLSEGAGVLTHGSCSYELTAER